MGLKRAALIERSWHCVPFMTSSPASVEVRFLESGAGRTRYQLFLHGASAPEVHDAHFTFEVGEDCLTLTWDGGISDLIVGTLTMAPKSAFDSAGDAQGFDSVLSVDRHLFPVGGKFPAGWPKEYWGKLDVEA